MENEITNPNNQGMTRRQFLGLSIRGLAASLIPPEVADRLSGEPKVPFSAGSDSEKYALSYSLSDLDLGEYCLELFSGLRQLSFGREGNLIIHSARCYNPEGKPNHISPVDGSVNIIPTDFNKENHGESQKVSDVGLLVLHYDGAPRLTEMGTVRTSLNTLNGLNDYRKASVHFCVDELTICKEGEHSQPEGSYLGYGILQTQLPSGDVEIPYRANHVSIEKSDSARGITLELFKKYGIDSKIEEYFEKSDLWIDNHSIGIEMIGKKYELDFPDNFPPLQQVSNTLSLILAIVNQYHLSPWDVIGHMEIQEKPDPGNLFMFLIRYSLGVAALTGAVSSPQVFSEDEPKAYFNTLNAYFRERLGGKDYLPYLGWLGIDRNPAPDYYPIKNPTRYVPRPM